MGVLYATLLFFAAPCLSQLVYPSMSSDVTVAEGGSFTITCSVPDDWAIQDGHCVQIYKKQIYFPNYAAPVSVSSWVDGEANGMLNKILSVNLEWHPRMYEDAAINIDNYNIQLDASNNIVITVTDAEETDGGEYTCRTLLADSNSTSVDHREAGSTANITVIAAIEESDVTLALCPNEGDCMDSLWPIEGQAVLNASHPERVGCRVDYGLSLPHVRLFFRNGTSEVTVTDMAILLSSPALVITGICAYRLNASALFYLDTDDIPLLGDYNGWELVCSAELPLVGKRETSVSVIAIVPTSPPSGSDNTDEPTGGCSRSQATLIITLASFLLSFLFLYV